MPTVLEAISQLKEMAVELKQPVNNVADTLAVYHKYEEEARLKRVASEEDRLMIDSVLRDINGHADVLEYKPHDILTKGSVRKTQGTSSYARHHLKQLQLQYRAKHQDDQT